MDDDNIFKTPLLPARNSQPRTTTTSVKPKNPTTTTTPSAQSIVRNWKQQVESPVVEFSPSSQSLSQSLVDDPSTAAVGSQGSSQSSSSSSSQPTSRTYSLEIDIAPGIAQCFVDVIRLSENEAFRQYLMQIIDAKDFDDYERKMNELIVASFSKYLSPK